MKEKNHIAAFFNYFISFYRWLKYKFWILPVLMVLTSLFDGIGIVMFFPLFEHLRLGSKEVANKTLLFIIRILDFLHLSSSLGGILLFICGIFLVKFLLNFIQHFFLQKTMYSLYSKISYKILHGWGGADYAKLYLNVNTGYFTSILGSSVWTFVGAFQYYCLIFVSIFYILIYLGIVFLLDPKITVIAVVFGSVVLYLFRNLTRLSKRYSREFTAEYTLLQNRLVEFMQFYKYFKSTAQFPKFYPPIENHINKISSSQFKQGVMGGFVGIMPETLATMLVALFLYVQLAIWHKDFGSVAVILMLFYKTFLTVVTLQGHWQKFFGCTGGIEIVEEALGKVDNYAEKTGRLKKDLFLDQIVLNGVNFSYGDKPILSDINLRLEKNKAVALVGASGSGKSTLVDLITGVLKPASGRISIDGIDYADIDMGVFRGIIGYVTQEIVIFNDSIFNNIALWDANDNQSGRRLREAAQKAYVDEFVKRMSSQYENVLGDRGIKLSVGQRQRIAIARELYRNPQIIIFDEATSALDTESENYIKKSIDNFRGNKTIIMIAHRLSTIKGADYIYVMDNGRIIEEGSFDALYGNKSSKFYQICQLQGFLNHA